MKHNKNRKIANRGTKGQMKLQQMAFMMIGVTIFFLFVGLFFARIIFSNVQKAAEEIKERDALLLVSKLANSPEFSCGESFGTFKINCIDGDKLIALIDNIEDYRIQGANFWKVDGITVRKIYPQDSSYQGFECSPENYPECSEFKVLDPQDKGIGVSNFVALCRKEQKEGLVQNKCEIAKIFVYYES
ncbi:hypothetical protein K0A97_01500 [Patescibacteria group bacterium]|nr:hypothetical protein [Patescibacteria group bacterium]